MITVEVKNLKTEMYKLRSRFVKLQQVSLGEALMDASEPLVASAQAKAPVRTGKLRGRIGPTLIRRYGRISVAVGPILLTRREKGFPYWGIMQERGFHATGRRTAKSRILYRTQREFRKSGRFIPGHHFLQRAGTETFEQVSNIFADRLFKKFAEIQEAGVAAGLV